MKAAAYRTPQIGIDSVEHEAHLLRLWETAPGLKGFLGSVDHKEIGLRYIVTAFLFLLLGGLEALLMRVQLAGPNRGLLTPDQYNQLFSTHGMTMIFLYASPILSGFSNYLWPLLLGSRDMAFPRLNALSYWIYLAAGIFLYTGFLTGNGPNDGWFNYVPYASRDYNPGSNQDFYALGMVLLGISTTVGAANFIVTAMRTRAPGMSVNRMPILIWGTLTASAANLFVVPAVSLAFFLLWMDRQFGHPFLRSGAAAANRCCGSICSGYSATPGSTPSCCPPWAWYRMVCRCSAGARWWVFTGGARYRRHHDSGVRGLGASHVRHRTAGFGTVVLFRCLDRDRAAVGCRGVCVACDHLAGAAGDYHGLPVLLVHDPAVCHWRRVGLHDGECAGGLAADGHLLRGGASALRADWYQCLSGAGGGVLLVSENDRAADG